MHRTLNPIISNNDSASAKEAVARQVFSAVFQLNPGEVHGAMSPETVDAWDSFGHMQLITALETRLGIQLRMDQIVAIDSYAALCLVLEGASGAK